MDASQLNKQVERDLHAMSMSSRGPTTAKGAKTSLAPGPPVAITKKGAIPVDAQITLERKVERDERGEHVTEHMTGLRSRDPQMLELNVQTM